MNAIERAARAGMTLRKLVELGNLDRRNVMDPMFTTPGLKRWDDAGQPEANFSKLEFYGSDEVRAVVLEVLRRIPTAAAHHALEHIVFVEVGREAAGWQGSMPALRPQLVALNGVLDDAAIADLIAHELAHGFSRQTLTTVARSASRAEETELLASVGATKDDFGRLARNAAAREREADDFAELWGFGRQYRSYL